MERVPCEECGIGILPKTAKATGGRCMPCAQEKESGREQEEARRRALGSGRKPKPREFMLFAALLVGFLVLNFLGKIALCVLVGLVARFGFGAGWDSALIVGVIAYLVLGFLGALGDLGDREPPERKRKRRE